MTFVDPAVVFTFFQVMSYQELTLNNRRLKIGWGKNSGPLPTSLALAVHAGATRNVYIGNVEDFETFTVERLKRDFSEYGEIELVNFLKEKCVYPWPVPGGKLTLPNRNCAFVNFTNISNAIKAIEGVKSKPEYASLRIAHGKDRCANPPRSGPQGGSGGRRAASNQHAHSQAHVNGRGTSAEPGSAVSGEEMQEPPFLNGVEAGEGEGEEDDTLLEVSDVGAAAQQMNVDGGEKKLVGLPGVVVTASSVVA